MGIVTREELRNRKALRTETKDVGGFGTVKYRELSTGESKKISTLQDKGFDVATYILTRGMLDSDGSPMFPNVELKEDGTLEIGEDDRTDLDGFGTSATAEIVDLILKLSGVKKDQTGPKP